MNFCSNISIVVPSYNRPRELEALFDSVLSQTLMPVEVIVVEDLSPQRADIRLVCEAYLQRFASVGVKLHLVENEVNLGFDKNLRKCLSMPTSKWALLLGNDDLLLPNAVEEFSRFTLVHDVPVVSRSFLRFEGDLSNTLGTSRLSDSDRVFRINVDSPKMIFRTGAFIGGLLFDVDFCRRNETSKYDGTLYYQIYLFALAFCGSGIGYIATPVAGGRAGNPPMFGASEQEKNVFIPGAYTAAARGKMWSGVLSIAADVQAKFGVNLLRALRQELKVRQSFHIFEMNAAAGFTANRNLARVLSDVGLFWHVVPISFFVSNVLLGRNAMPIYRWLRNFYQKS